MNTGNGARAFAFFTGLSFRYEFVHVPIVFLCFVLVFFGCDDRGAFGIASGVASYVVCPSIFDIRYRYVYTYPIPFHSGGDPMKVTRATCIAAYR